MDGLGYVDQPGDKNEPCHIDKPRDVDETSLCCSTSNA
jgi:hypothetical protein